MKETGSMGPLSKGLARAGDGRPALDAPENRDVGNRVRRKSRPAPTKVRPTQCRNAGTQPVRQPATAPDNRAANQQLLFRITALGPSYGRLGLAPLTDAVE